MIIIFTMSANSICMSYVIEYIRLGFTLAEKHMEAGTIVLDAFLPKIQAETPETKTTVSHTFSSPQYTSK
jgi:hypothetical protein